MKKTGTCDSKRELPSTEARDGPTEVIDYIVVHEIAIWFI
jgi:predicted metal-dependent hydrolase